MGDLLIFWTITGGCIYWYLCETKAPPESVAICWTITAACGPAVWLYIAGRWWNERLRGKANG